MASDYDSSSSTDSTATARAHHNSRIPLLPTRAPHSAASSQNTTPVPSRSPSPHPHFYHDSSTTDEDSDTASSPPRTHRSQLWSDDRRRMWTASPRLRKREVRFLRTLKRWTRRLLRHPFFPRKPITIVLTLILFSVFAILLTLFLMYILNPDKEPLPWRAYCSVPSSSYSLEQLPQLSASPNQFLYPDTSQSASHVFPPDNLDTLAPAGVFVAVFSIDSAIERRMLVRTTWASHPRSRNGAGEGDEGAGTSRTLVRFVMGQPRKDWERRIKLEMETYNDIILLPTPENMNGGKTYTFFSWAARNAWVPPVYYKDSILPPSFPPSDDTIPPPLLAPHDPIPARLDQNSTYPRPWVRPDYIIKVDDDAFVILAELEARLRVQLHTSTQFGTLRPFKPQARDFDWSSNLGVPNNTARESLSTRASDGPLIYWGYLVTNRLHQFMAGELYGLSWSLIEWISKDPTVKGLTRGKEDKQTAKWMRLHPRASEIRYASERCWIYDHPRSGTVYSHGFLFPSEVTRVKNNITVHITKTVPEIVRGNTQPNLATPSSWAHSTVSTFGVRYVAPVPELTTSQSVEALIEGSEMSMLREGGPLTPESAWRRREGRKTRYENRRVGGTIVVHFIKKHMWFLETAFALLEGDEASEAERSHGGF